jgi:hypothetical protein
MEDFVIDFKAEKYQQAKQLAGKYIFFFLLSMPTFALFYYF